MTVATDKLRLIVKMLGINEYYGEKKAPPVRFERTTY